MNRRQKKKKCKQQTTVFVRCNMPARAEDYRRMKDSIEYQLRTGSAVILPEYLHIEAIIQQNGSKRIEIKDSEEKYTLDQIVDAMVQEDGTIILAIKHQDREWVKNVLKDHL